MNNWPKDNIVETTNQNHSHCRCGKVTDGSSNINQLPTVERIWKANDDKLNQYLISTNVVGLYLDRAVFGVSDVCLL